MNKCNKCEGTNIKRESHNKYHDIFVCLTCENWEFKRIEECCRDPFTIVTIERKDFPLYFLYRQCINCGGSNRTKPLNSKQFGDEIRSEFVTENYEDWLKERTTEAKNLYESKKHYNYFNSPYYKYVCYLSSYEWKEKRKLALERDNNLCQDCKEKSADEVHHLTYEHLFNEPLEDLKSLCRGCHVKAHGRTLPEFISKEHQIHDMVK